MNSDRSIPSELMKLLDVRKLDAEAARRSFRVFVELMWSVAEPARRFISNWHIDAIADHLQAVTEGKIRRLLITVPPGHAKSLIVSVLWLAWMWTRDPQIRAIFSSYSEDLAIRDSLRCRSVVSSEQYRRLFRPTWRLAIDQNEKNWFENDKKGVRMALSVGGKGTGFRADHLVVDDPLNARDQHSRSALEEVINWFDQAMSSRLNDPAHGGIVIIMQRLSELDLAAHVLRRDGYVHLNLPSCFEPERACATVALRSGQPIWRDPRDKMVSCCSSSCSPKA